MKKSFQMLLMLSALISSGFTLTKTVEAQELPDHPYIDFSSDRSTWFFKNDGENKVAFFDFFFPFDPTVKLEAYDPLVMHEFERPYYTTSEGTLMIHLEELEKMYDPYFDFTIAENQLHLHHTVFEKEVIDGYGERSTTLSYKKKVWDVQLPIDNNGDFNRGIYNYQEYMPVTGGRNKEAIEAKEVNVENSENDVSFTFSKGSVEVKDGEYYVPLTEIMEVMGKETWKEMGYTVVQDQEMPDVTKSIQREEQDVHVAEVRVPSPSNSWNGGEFEGETPDYYWADYMNDVIAGKRESGWLWKTLYISSEENFKDQNGHKVSLNSNRIVPYSLYVPQSYNKNETRMTVMLHGGTGNEHTPTSRLIEEDLQIEKYAEDLNHILLSPSGWTQNPVWRQHEALDSFEQSFEKAMHEFPVKSDQVFLTGNSLGGRGTVELAMRFPDRFRAIAATAPKITDRAPDSGTMVNIIDTDYDLNEIKGLPTLIVQGTADTTTSFKVQIGNDNEPGSIVSAIMPKLNNASYMTVEEGEHSYAYGAALKVIFEHFEKQLSNASADKEVKELTLFSGSEDIEIDGAKAKLKFPILFEEGESMISLYDLEKIYGEDLNVYPIHLYDSAPGDAPDFWTLFYKSTSINFNVDETSYRVGMERYKEDAKATKNGGGSDEHELRSAPRFSVAPTELEGEVYVPVKEIFSVLNLNLNIEEQSFSDRYRTPIYLSGVGAIAIGLVIYISMKIIKRKR